MKLLNLFKRKPRQRTLHDLSDSELATIKQEIERRASVMGIPLSGFAVLIDDNGYKIIPGEQLAGS